MNTEKRNAAAYSSEIPKIIKRFGSTTYEVHVHFSETSKETLQDKMLRIIGNDIRFSDAQ
jgi:hypothetical protein